MAILFDLDGTLLDTAPDMYVAVNKVMQEYNRPDIPYDKFRNEVSAGADKVLQLGGIDDIIKDKDKYKVLKYKFLQYYKETNFADTKPFPGIMELLDLIEQHNIKWGIVTNRLENLTAPVLDVVNLTTRSACVVSGDTASHAKPHPAPLYYACKQIDVVPEDCVYIGDDERDITAGNRAGMLTIAALYGYISDLVTAKSWQQDVSVENIVELTTWLTRWLQK